MANIDPPKAIIRCFGDPAEESEDETGVAPPDADQVEYLRKRERHERAAAQEAEAPSSRGAHHRLAQAYAAKIRNAAPGGSNV